MRRVAYVPLKMLGYLSPTALCRTEAIFGYILALDEDTRVLALFRQINATVFYTYWKNVEPRIIVNK